MKKLLPLLIFSQFYFLDLPSQAAVLPAGGDASGSGGSVAYSIGQAAYTHIDGESGRISLGVQQPHFVIMVNTEELDIQIDATLYPNPVRDEIYLVLHDAPVESLDINELSLRLHDVAGREIIRKNIADETTSLSLHELSESVYILTVYHKNVALKSFRIFKSK